MIRFDELRKDSDYSPRRRYLRLAVNVSAIVLLIVICSVLPLKNSQVQLLYTMCVFALMATSLNITMGLMGQLSLGHCGFMAVGAYAGTYTALALYNAGVTTYIVLFLAGLVAGTVAAGIVGLIVGIPALRLRGDYLTILTLGFGLIVVSILNNIVGPTLNNRVCRLYISSKQQSSYIWLVILVTAFVIGLIFTFGRSKYGRAMMSLRDNEIAATASGINASYYKTAGFVFSAATAGVAGVLFTMTASTLTTSSFAFTSPTIYNSVFIVVMVVMGGMGSLTGSIILGAGMVYINNLITKIPKEIPVLGALAQYPMMLYAIVLIIFILFRPRGIFNKSEFSLYNTIIAAPDFFRHLPEHLKAFGCNVRDFFAGIPAAVKKKFSGNGGKE